MPNNELFKLENHLKSYLNEKKMLNMTKNTILTYSRVLESFLKYYRGYYDEISIEKIDRAFIVSYLDSKGFSIGSKNLHAVILKNFFCYLQKHFYTDIDFKSRLEHLTLKLPQKEPTALSASEYETVMAYFLKETHKRKRTFHSYRNFFMLKVILLCGVRVSECLNIKCEDITVVPSKEELPSIYKIHLLGKGNKERYAYIPQEMIEKELLFLQSYIGENTLSTSSLCITKEGRVLGRSEVYAMVESFLKNRKIPKRGVHMLRHSFGKHMVSKNINLSTIKALMGHENIQTTLIYARSDEESMIRAVV